MSQKFQQYFQQLILPQPNSHKGQNGKLLIIGGSDLFHAASKWSLDIASRFVDMVFYSSEPSNNELIQKAKSEFWNGIVIERADLESYVEEADCILIGPGMTRTANTEKITNRLLKKYPHKKWVIDAGALQMVEPKLLNTNCIVTPHAQEFVSLFERAGGAKTQLEKLEKELTAVNCEDQKAAQLKQELWNFSQLLNGATILRKGECDVIFQMTAGQPGQFEIMSGGNAGMTKGGTGDVLAGLVAGLYTCSPIFAAAVAASYINKQAGDQLFQKVGPFFNSSDLVQEIPKLLWQEIQGSAR